MWLEPLFVPLCSTLEILLLMMSMVEGWSFMILEWWGGIFWTLCCVSTVRIHWCILFLKCCLSCAFTLSAPCSISQNIREGLLETFYGIYEKNPDKVIIFTKEWWPLLALPYVNVILFPCLFVMYLSVETRMLVQVLQAMIQMGVLVPTGDMTAVRRTAQFFLNRCSV